MIHPKRWYPVVYGSTSGVLLALAARAAWRGPGRALAIAQLIVHAGPPAFLASLYLRGRGRTSVNLPLLRGSGLVGAMLAAGLAPRRSSSWSGWLTVAANEAYVRWYAKLGRGASTVLRVGATMPEVEFTAPGGRLVAVSEFRGAPTALLFYRGNWCPLCVAQIGELAARWRALADLGVRVALISPQDDAHTRQLAARFDVAFEYLRDPGLKAASALGIVHRGGVPVGMVGYDADTVFPTLVVLDRRGTVVFCDQTDDYRLRPDPELVIAALRSAG